MGSREEGWDWEWIKYVGKVILLMTEEYFWQCTPREFFALQNVHIKINTVEKDNKTKPTGFIDQVL